MISSKWGYGLKKNKKKERNVGCAAKQYEKGWEDSGGAFRQAQRNSSGAERRLDVSIVSEKLYSDNHLDGTTHKNRDTRLANNTNEQPDYDDIRNII